MRIYDEIQRIEASRQGPEEVDHIYVVYDRPRTANGLLYPETTVVQIPEGRIPEWMQRVIPLIRRPETAEEYGFFTPYYNWVRGDKYIAINTSLKGDVFRILHEGASVGWIVDEEMGFAPGPRTYPNNKERLRGFWASKPRG